MNGNFHGLTTQQIQQLGFRTYNATTQNPADPVNNKEYFSNDPTADDNHNQHGYFVTECMYIVSSGNPSMTTLAKSAIKNVLIGITVILVAFISITFIINTVFQNEKSELKVKENGLSGFGGNMWNFTGDCGSSVSGNSSNQANTSSTAKPKYDGQGNVIGMRSIQH